MPVDDGNPYQTPVGVEGPASEEPASERRPRQQRQVTLLLDDDSLGNLRLISTATKFAAVFSLFCAWVPIVQVIALFRIYGMPGGWESVHTLTCVRLLFVPLWIVVGRQLWKYSLSVRSFCNGQGGSFEVVIERQTKVWIAVQTLLMSMIFLVVMIFLYRSLLDVLV